MTAEEEEEEAEEEEAEEEEVEEEGDQGERKRSMDEEDRVILKKINREIEGLKKDRKSRALFQERVFADLAGLRESMIKLREEIEVLKKK